MSNETGKLYIVSTPIGNLSDITFRAIDTLKNVDLILAEDTRNTMKLLKEFQINTKLSSYHEHNKFDKVDSIINEILQGKNIALVSDAGTPLISDPGDLLVEKAILNNIDLVPVPGVTALITALTISGLDTKEFIFLGFLSDEKKERIKKLKCYKLETKTLVFYISPHKFIKHMEDIIEVLGPDRKAALTRELTKIHEEVFRDSLYNIYENYKDDIKGEIVLVVSGVSLKEKQNSDLNLWEDLTLKEHIDMYIKMGLNEKDAMKKVASDRNINKREVYKTLKIV